MGAHLVRSSFQLAVCGVAGLALAACGSSSPSAAPPASSPTSGAPSATPTQPMSSTPTPTPVSTSSAPTVSANLAVTNQIRSDLIAAGAKARGLKASDFTSLQAGMTYYAYDPATQTYWAGGALVPSSKSYQAQVSSQDDGGYTLFHKVAGGAWVATDSGMAGPNSGQGAGPCRVVPPPSILALWGWPAKSCHPNGV